MRCVMCDKNVLKHYEHSWVLWRIYNCKLINIIKEINKKFTDWLVKSRLSENCDMQNKKKKYLNINE